jgi:uncharacterized membrane protein (UPF0127 family)
MRVLSVLVALAAGPAFAAECSLDRVTIEGGFGTAHFSVAVADDRAEQAQGLMNVPELGTLEGMLFVYESPRRPSFWMKNTLIPLDMIFAAPDGTIRHIHEEAVPLDTTPIRTPEGIDDILFVLEINGGLSGRLGIEPGDVIQHPLVGPEAALPCG